MTADEDTRHTLLSDEVNLPVQRYSLTHQVKNVTSH